MENTFSGLTKGQIDYKEVVKPYLKHWKWFTISLLFSIFLAIIYIRYSTPEYAVEGKIQILEDQNATSELGAFKDLDLFTAGNTRVEDEIEIMNSRSNMIEVARNLGLNLRIHAQGQIHSTELYHNAAPIKIKFLLPDSLVYLSRDAFKIKITSATTFLFSEDDDKPSQSFGFGSKISTKVMDLVLIPNDTAMSKHIGREFRVVLTPLVSVAQSYKKKLKISLDNDKSNVITISLKDPVEQKAKDIINGLIDTYNQNAVEDKRLIANKTSDFINDRIREISGDLSSVDQSAQEFKSGRGITNVESQSNANISISAQSQQELQNASMQLNIANSMKNIVDNQNGFEILPSNVGISDATIANTTATYNQLVSERNRLLRSSNEKNPIIVSLDEQLNGLKKSLQASLNSTTNNLNMQVNNLSSRLSQVNARIYAAPGNERALRDITRQQQTTESLYLYLLQKREESQITFASATPKSNIIDRAYETSQFPVSPQKPKILLAFMILGLLLPFSIIYVNQILDNKVHNKVILEKHINNIPVLAELPKLKKSENRLVRTGERTILAESLRILRTNLDYIIRSKNIAGGKGNVIFVTSTVPGEGKTLVSANLAMIFAKANKKVLLIGADIRNPKVYEFYSGKNVDRLGKPTRDKTNNGLTDFLVDNTISISDIINPLLANEQTVDVIYSGKIPPNPSELLMSERMKELLTSVPAEYDYVIVDTAPLMVVSDTLLISEFADQILYVVRAGVTELKVLNFPLKLHSEGKLKGLAFVVNGVKESNLGYGGKYGYGYGKAEKKWWKFGA